MPEVKYSYSDIVLEPKYSECKSRSDLDTSVIFGGKRLKLPIIVSNMTTCIDNKLAKWLSNNGYGYIFHRFSGPQNQKDLLWFVEKANKESWPLISISVGVKQEDKELLQQIKFKGLRLDWVCIDVAHGHSILVQSMAHYIRMVFPNIFLIAGNIATAEAVRDYKNWSINCAKLGIGSGKSCITAQKTRFYTPMFSTIKNVIKYTKNHDASIDCSLPIIADGGIRENGDITVGLVAGADIIMAASLFASCTNSPAEIIREDKTGTYKLFYGSASKNNKVDNKHIEGKPVELLCNRMSYEEKLKEIEQDLQSSMSYGGCKTVYDLRNVNWNIIHR